MAVEFHRFGISSSLVLILCCPFFTSLSVEPIVVHMGWTVKGPHALLCYSFIYTHSPAFFKYQVLKTSIATQSILMIFSEFKILSENIQIICLSMQHSHAGQLNTFPPGGIRQFFKLNKCLKVVEELESSFNSCKYIVVVFN